MKKKAVILLSGGLDSGIALYLAKSQGFEPHAISFCYGQKHSKELECAKQLGETVGVTQHQIVDLNMNAWGGSSLTDSKQEIETGDVERTDIPSTYVPARNMVFLSLAASYAEAIGARDIFIGVSQVDYSGYVDCREEFITSMENTINQGTVCAVEKGEKIKIHAPFMYKTKSEEIQIGVELGVDFGLTWSCYRGTDKPCGTCDSCLLRADAFEKAGVIDPTV